MLVFGGKMETGVNKLLEGTGEAIKTVPELYDDGLKPAVQESGKTLSLLPKTINAALVPLRKWIAEREYSLAETEKLLEIKLRNIDHNKIVTPEAYVAVPALQAISYSMDSEELRKMYADMECDALQEYKEFDTDKEAALYFNTCRHRSILFAARKNKDYSRIIWQKIKEMVKETNNTML